MVRSLVDISLAGAAANLDVLCTSPALCELPARLQILLLSDVRLECDEWSMCVAALECARHNEKLLPRLLSLVRLGDLGRDRLIQASQHPLIAASPECRRMCDEALKMESCGIDGTVEVKESSESVDDVRVGGDVARDDGGDAQSHMRIGGRFRPRMAAPAMAANQPASPPPLGCGDAPKAAAARRSFNVLPWEARCGAWTDGPRLHVYAHAILTSECDGVVYATDEDKILAIDVKNGESTWSELRPPLETAVIGYHIHIVNGTLIAMNFDGVMLTVHRYDAAQKKWTLLNELEFRGEGSTAVHEDKILMMGTGNDSLMCLDPSETAAGWRVLAAAPRMHYWDEDTCPIQLHSYDGRLIAVGGENNTVKMLNESKWCDAEEIEPRSLFIGGLSSSGKTLAVAGGGSHLHGYSPSVWVLHNGVRRLLPSLGVDGGRLECGYSLLLYKHALIVMFDDGRVRSILLEAPEVNDY